MLATMRGSSNTVLQHFQHLINSIVVHCEHDGYDLNHFQVQDVGSIMRSAPSMIGINLVGNHQSSIFNLFCVRIDLENRVLVLLDSVHRSLGFLDVVHRDRSARSFPSLAMASKARSPGPQSEALMEKYPQRSQLHPSDDVLYLVQSEEHIKLRETHPGRRLFSTASVGWSNALWSRFGDRCPLRI